MSRRELALGVTAIAICAAVGCGFAYVALQRAGAPAVAALAGGVAVAYVLASLDRWFPGLSARVPQGAATSGVVLGVVAAPYLARAIPDAVEPYAAGVAGGFLLSLAAFMALVAAGQALEPPPEGGGLSEDDVARLQREQLRL